MSMCAKCDLVHRVLARGVRILGAPFFVFLYPFVNLMAFIYAKNCADFKRNHYVPFREEFQMFWRIG